MANENLPITSTFASEKLEQHSEDDNNCYSDLSDHSGKDKNSKIAKKKNVGIKAQSDGQVKENITITGAQQCGETVSTVTSSFVKNDSDFELKKVGDSSGHDLEADDIFDVTGETVPSDVRLDRFTPQRALSNISLISVGTSSYYGDGNSVCGASTDGSISRSRSESIRARLRQQERKLSEMVHRQANAEGVVGDKFKQEMTDVKSNLDKVEQEKYALEQKLEFLKNQQLEDQAMINNQDVTDHDAFLRDKLNGIQRGFQEQASKIQALENEVVAKNADIDKYRYEIVAKLKRIVELEFDLEMHDIHYTDYADNQFKLGDEASLLMKDQGNQEESTDKVDQSEFLDETTSLVNEVDIATNLSNNSEKGGEGHELIEIEGTLGGEKTKLTPKRAQKLIAKLLRDLDHLEATYKKEKLKTVQTKEHLKNENEELRTKIHVLELEQKHQQTVNKNGRGGMNDVSGYLNIYQLRKRVETLEAKRFLYRKEMLRLEEEMKQFQQEANMKAQKHEIEVSRLKLELDAAKVCCSNLLEEQSEKEEGTRENHYSVIEQRILENYDMIAKLEASSEIKDRQIDSLKNEVQRLRLQQIAKGKAGSKYSQIDADVLKSEKETSNKFNGENDSSENEDEECTNNANVSASFVADLQKQLLLAHEQLVKKDQELVIERAKSACMAANLLDRIAELDKEAEKSKRRESMRHGVEKTASNDSSHVRDDTVRSSRSIQVDDQPDKRRKPKKNMASRIPFRFNLPGGKKE